jgi:hypothetical protein
MKLLKTSTVLAAASVLLMAASAGASFLTKDYVATAGGSAVVTKFGDCVITKWDAKGGNCVGASLTSELRTVYFNFNSSALTPAAKTKLTALAKTLKTSNRDNRWDCAISVATPNAARLPINSSPMATPTTAANPARLPAVTLSTARYAMLGPGVSSTVRHNKRNGKSDSLPMPQLGAIRRRLQSKPSLPL